MPKVLNKYPAVSTYLSGVLKSHELKDILNDISQNKSVTNLETPQNFETYEKEGLSNYKKFLKLENNDDFLNVSAYVSSLFFTSAETMGRQSEEFHRHKVSSFF